MLADVLFHHSDQRSARRVAEEVIERVEPGPDRALAMALWSVWLPARLEQADQAIGEAGNDPACGHDSGSWPPPRTS